MHICIFKHTHLSTYKWMCTGRKQSREVCFVLGALCSPRPPPSNCHGYHSLLLPSLSLPSSSSSLPSSWEWHLMMKIVIRRNVGRAALFITKGWWTFVTLWCQDSFGRHTYPHFLTLLLTLISTFTNTYPIHTSPHLPSPQSSTFIHISSDRKN